MLELNVRSQGRLVPACVIEFSASWEAMRDHAAEEEQHN